MNPRTLTRAALAATVLLVVTLLIPIGPADATHRRTTKQYSYQLIDLQPDVSNPTDGARGLVVVKSHRGHTHGTMLLFGVEPGAGLTAHGHTGECVAGNTGPHYQDEVGGAVDDVNELWFGPAEANRRGVYWYTTRVEWEPRPGEMPIVAIHDRNAGNAQVACFELVTR